MFGLAAYYFFLEQVSSGIIFRLHFAIESILLDIFIFFILLVFLEFIIENYVIFEFILVFSEKRMFDHAGESQPFFTVNHENSLEKVLKFISLFSYFLFFRQCRGQAKSWIPTSSLNFSLHVVTLIINQLPLKGYSANSIK